MRDSGRSDNPLLSAAVAYVRTETFFASGDPHTAARALDHAADQLPTRDLKQAPTTAALGPASLRIHELAVAAELRDAAGIQRASTWHPPAELPAERRSHYYIDLARAQLDLDHHEPAYLCLQAARQAAPEHVRAHPQVRQALSVLLRTHPSLSSGLLDLAAWAAAR